jgi:hypothetical protein
VGLTTYDAPTRRSASRILKDGRRSSWVESASSRDPTKWRLGIIGARWTEELDHLDPLHGRVRCRHVRGGARS